MKTIDDFLEEIEDHSFGYGSLYDRKSVEKIMKEYAEQALDLAAETVDFKEVHYSEVGDESAIENDMGDIYVIDKSSITLLKDQLK